MARFVRMPLEDGGSVVVEVADDGTDVQRIGRERPAVQDAAETLQQALSRVRPAVDAVLDTVRGMAERPDRVTLEFGIRLSAEAGVVVARAATEANFTVSVEWSRDGRARHERDERAERERDEREERAED
jgi:Trypsin-co-occurring domain 1